MINSKTTSMIRSLLIMLTLMITLSFSCFGLTPKDTLWTIPSENIIRANTIYLTLENQNRVLLKMDSLRTGQVLSLNLAYNLCRQENILADKIMQNSAVEIQNLNLMIGSYKKANRLLMGALLITLTWGLTR